MNAQPALAQPAEFLRALREDLRLMPHAHDLEAALGVSGSERMLERDWSLKAIHQAALALAEQARTAPELRPLFERAIGFYTGRPIREWDEVVWALELACAEPRAARPLIRTVIVSVRLGVKGDVPSLANIGKWGDASHELLPLIAGKLEQLFVKRAELGEALFRQLIKSLPHLGATDAELYDLRGAPEELQYLLDCPLTMDIREQVHSHAAPANLALIRAYLRYLEKGDPSGLAQLWLSQKIMEHDRLLAAAPDPAGLKQKLIACAREMETILARIYAFDPESKDSVLADITLWLAAAGAHAPEGAAQLVDLCRRGDTRGAVAALPAVRVILGKTIAASAPDDGLRLLYLDLELEKLGYLLFGEAVNDWFATLTLESLSGALDLLRAMILSEALKGWESPRLAWLAEMLSRLPDGAGRRLPQLLVLNHQINDEIARIGLGQYQNYSAIIRSVLEACQVPNVEMEVNRFVDGLIRGTTLQHIGELVLRLYHFTLGALESPAYGTSEEAHTRVEQYHRTFESAAARLAGATKPAPAVPLWIYRFQPGHAEGAELGPGVLGGKGANLLAMCAMGLAVPPGFVVSVGACSRYMSIHALDPAVHQEIHAAIAWLEQAAGRALGTPRRPLLVSVRSGAPVSMPGMLATILNVGMNDAVARSLAEEFSNEGAALDAYGRFLTGYAKSVFAFTALPDSAKPPATWETIARIKKSIREAGIDPFWEDVREQVIAAVEATFRSWNNPHAVLFRTIGRMPQTGCTAATVQQMVFGNADARSCTGVVYTRNPTTGAHALSGEYLPGAQGEELMSGLRTPLPVGPSALQPGQSLLEIMPDIVSQLQQCSAALESRFGAPQEIEFTVERGKLYILQTRSVRAGTAAAAVRREAPQTATEESGSYRIIARGLGASPGGVFGRIALTPEAVRAFARAGAQTIFVRDTTTPEDLAGMAEATGVLTRRGGITSHAANNARYMGKPCVVGCAGLEIDRPGGGIAIGGVAFREGDRLFIDGMSGEVGVPLGTA